MAKLNIKAGSTSETVNVFIQNSSSTTGAGLTGLVYNSASLTAYYVLPRAAAAAITLATQTVTGSYSSGGFVEIDATNCPGLYRLDIPNAALASGRFVTIHMKGATNMAPLLLEIDLAGQVDTVSISGTAQTARDIGASVLLSSGTGTGQVKLSSGYIAPNWGDVGNPTTSLALTGTTIATTQKVDVDTIKTNPVVNAGTITFPTTATLASTTNITAGTITTCTNLTNAATAGDLTAAMIASVTTAATAATPTVLLTAGTGTGQIDFTSGVVKANLAQILGTALTETAGWLAAGFKKWFNVATPVATINSLPGALPGATNGVLIAGTNANPATLDIVGSITGNLSGSVGSVTGAVGSVTGNVGGNVTGTVASVVGAVGSVTGNVGGNVVGSVASVAAAITLPTIPTDWIAAAGVSAAAGAKIADINRRRTQANVESSSDGDTLSMGSEYGMIQQAQESNTTAHADKLTIFQTDGTTELGQRTIATDAAADPITGIS